MKNKTELCLEEWLLYFETRQDKPIHLGLDRIIKVAKTLNLLNLNAPVITVTGTNGKGSTIAHLKAIYMSGGYKVAAYTSPHLLRFNERIQINHEDIADSVLLELFSLLHETPGSEKLTYFEITTLAALKYFKDCAPDIILLEVGMGGRLDATNIIDSNLAIVTSVALDHEDYLGNTLDAIAFEKAGIFRKNQTAIYAGCNPPKSLIKQAAALSVNLSILGKEDAFHTALYAVNALQKLVPIAISTIENSSNHFRLYGRQQWLDTRIPTLIDVAHNPQAARRLADYLARQRFKGKVHAILGGLQDKQLSGLIEPMRPFVTHWYLTCLNHSRSATKSMLETAFQNETDLAAPPVFEAPHKAYKAAINASNIEDIILVYGSFILISAIMKSHYKQGRIL